jgi:hypothetical protein
MLASVLSVLGIGRFGRLPLNASLFCLAGIAGAVVARGTAYPGRFSVHLIPVTVAMSVCAVSLLSGYKDIRMKGLAARRSRASDAETPQI